MSLERYRKKRNFKESPEPRGTARKKPAAKKLRYCVQKHLASSLHYDFRLEHRGVLLSWAVPKGPSLDPDVKRLAIHVEDHPYDYGKFEGVIPSGYGAGIVMLWDEGFWKPHSDVAEALEKGHLSFDLSGKKMKGAFALTRIKAEGTTEQWLLVKKKDAHCANIDVATEKPMSVKSRKDFPGILRGGLPKIWLDNPPTKGGAAGKMLSDAIQRARGKKRT
jgi:bifunctional non-homologous end joining protein LigD